MRRARRVTASTAPTSTAPRSTGFERRYAFLRIRRR